ncbi:(+)-neomenthol dehydrogenase [Primulina huaijiensis]|uniref:(+)-neomenthol dehydrogenase n=1 Tax=Primulina huaijiensis TaxID=1492673 RepID=UPI003CC74265
MSDEETRTIFFASSRPCTIARWWSKETVAIVTGANKGIGFELVKRLAELGLTVVLTARDDGRGLEAVRALKGEGLDVHFFCLDVSNSNSIKTFASWFQHTFGVLDILINNAAVSFNDLRENSVKHAETVIRTNFYGPKLLTEALLPLFRCSPFGSRVLNISSRLGMINKLENHKLKEILKDEENLSENQIEGMLNLFLQSVKNGTWKSYGWPQHWTDYSVSKLALNSYSKILAKQYKGNGISVNCFCPGFTQTSMTGGKGMHTADAVADVGAWLALLPMEKLQTGKFYVLESHNHSNHSKL